jgi:hypothetical protein
MELKWRGSFFGLPRSQVGIESLIESARDLSIGDIRSEIVTLLTNC